MKIRKSLDIFEIKTAKIVYLPQLSILVTFVLVLTAITATFLYFSTIWVRIRFRQIKYYVSMNIWMRVYECPDLNVEIHRLSQQLLEKIGAIALASGNGRLIKINITIIII